MLQVFIALLSGIIFSLGLWLSDMVNPARVRSFLDIFGDWDPALMFVMGFAILVALPGFHWLKKKDQSLCGTPLNFPDRKKLDFGLIIGSMLFGIGWGLSGICPGPLVVVLPVAFSDVAIFIIMMLAGTFAANRLRPERPDQS